MPVLEREEGEIYYEVTGASYPVLALAPGWLRSTTASNIVSRTALVR